MASEHLSINDMSLKARNFKCFGDKDCGFDVIKPMNIIIGRNNSGKSSLLDLVQYVTDPNSVDFENLGHKGNSPEALESWVITPQICGERLPEQANITRSNNTSVRFNPRTFGGKHFVGLRLVSSINKENNLSTNIEKADADESYIKYFSEKLAHATEYLWTQFHTQRILADRDIVREANNKGIDLNPNGNGFTNLIQNYINDSRLDRDLVEIELLNELNAIFYPDAFFKRILVELFDDTHWEIYLEEEKKGRIPMSQTGSGLKTVLQVLANMLIVPRLIGKPNELSSYLFCFEELENNLHPAIQRRLFSYLHRKAIEHKCHFFITTHSNVVIDMFSQDKNAQILHVKHDGECATVKTVTTFEEGHSVLDDLDVRASDLLQTNVVVWVEGPSDIIYFNKWINLWTDGLLIEGIHYQCLPYGGNINAHFSFENPEDVDRLIPALKINRNVIMLADSDKKASTDELKEQTIRLASEIEAVGGYAWITQGKEVENYIPLEALKIFLSDNNLKGTSEYKSVLRYIADKTGKKTEPIKVELAREVTEMLQKKWLSETLDLATQLDEVVRRIRMWNRIDE